jgi:hypothetical protein
MTKNDKPLGYNVGYQQIEQISTSVIFPHNPKSGALFEQVLAGTWTQTKGTQDTTWDLVSPLNTSKSGCDKAHSSVSYAQDTLFASFVGRGDAKSASLVCRGPQACRQFVRRQVSLSSLDLNFARQVTSTTFQMQQPSL